MKQLFKPLMPAVLLFLAGYSGIGSAKTSSELVTSQNKGAEFQLEVRQMPMAQVIDMVSRKTHVPIHYSVLPEGLVTATCVGSTLKQVLECLLDRKADIIVRNSVNAIKDKAMAGQVAEAWILGSKLAATNSGTGYCVANTEHSTDNLSLTVRQAKQSAEVELELEQTNELLQSAQSKNSEERVEAIGALLSVQNNDDPAIKAALEKALTDQNAKVRAQAISSLAGLEGDAAAGAIQEALHDTSADVRLMAVDAITNDIPSLQQAINDSDETVRTLASMKLGDLNQATNVVQK
jgi:hypothetical protein